MELGNGTATTTAEFRAPKGAENNTAKFDLMLTISERGSELIGTFEYNIDLFEGATIGRMSEHLKEFLRAVALEPDQSIWKVRLLGAAERQLLLEQWNKTEMSYEREVSIAELFERQVEQRPEAIAVLYEGEQLSYAELNARANQLARYLRANGVKAEERVGLCVERTVAMVIGLLGILKAGAAYVPLDTQYPVARLQYMLSDAQVRVLLTEAHLEERVVGGAATVVRLDSNWAEIGRQKRENLGLAIDAEHPAYIIYTSGSTGLPKGVAVTHGNVVRLFRATDCWFHFNEDDVWTLFHSYAFDFSVWEIWGPLLYGGKLVVVAYETSRDPDAFKRLLLEKRVTVLNQTPSAFLQLIREADEFPGPVLRLVIFGGEALELRALQPWFERNGDKHPQLINMYGITETTVHVTYRPLTAEDAKNSVSMIGKPIRDLNVYVLDRYLQPAPIGVPGELHVAGAGLARGYLNRAELTAERFIPNPLGGEGERLYKTGDLARFHADGDLEYLGRIDQQVKIRGFRIELGEIEAALREQNDVREAVVIARVEFGGEQRLVGYVVSEDGVELEVEALRQALRAKLPEYMLPSALVVLAALPLTSNGKLDRRALPAPEGSSSAEEYVAPRTPVEELIAAVFREVLGVERVGVADNFFDLGGHSLLAVRLMACVARKTGQILPLATLFRSPTIESLSSALTAKIENSRWSPLVQIQAGGEELPFFCVHPGGGNVLCYAELFTHLGTKRPFYGLQAYGLDGEQAPLQRVEEMASRYIEAMLSVQSKGPYLLGGWSLGGLIAFEMAHQLVARGEEIALLTLFDTSLPSAAVLPVQEDDTSMLIGFAHDCGLTANDLNISFPQFNKLGREEKLAYVLDQGKAAGRIPSEIGLAQIQNLVRVFESNVRAGDSYKAMRYNGAIDFIQGERHQGNWRKRYFVGLEKIST